MRLALTALLGVAVGLGACAPDRVDIHDEPDDGADYGRGEMLAAVQAFAAGPRDPTSYRTLAVTIEDLRPQFDAVVAKEAERHLVLLALAPLEEAFELSMDEQFERLALSVWPTALGVQPKSGETPAQYAERICANELALSCNRTVDRWRPLVLSGLVWSRMKARAREAVSHCRVCAGEPGYDEIITKYDDYDAKMSALLGKRRGMANPGRWPIKGANAKPLTDAAVFAVDGDGKATYAGELIEPGAWREALTERRGDAKVVSVHLEPRAQVRVLRQIAADASAAGFDTLALQVRDKDYPFPLSEYRVTTAKRAKKIRVRDVETIQVLVQALDALTETRRL